MRQTSCKHCGSDIEGAGRDWRDRGSGTRCPEFCGYDQDGVSIYRPSRLHQPWPLVWENDAQLPTRHYSSKPYGYVELLKQPR